MILRGSALSGLSRQGHVVAAVFGNRESRWKGAGGGVGVVQLVPGALVAPFAASLGDRYPRNRVFALGNTRRALGYGSITAKVSTTSSPSRRQA